MHRACHCQHFTHNCNKAQHHHHHRHKNRSLHVQLIHTKATTFVWNGNLKQLCERYVINLFLQMQSAKRTIKKKTNSFILNQFIFNYCWYLSISLYNWSCLIDNWFPQVLLLPNKNTLSFVFFLSLSLLQNSWTVSLASKIVKHKSFEVVQCK